MEENQEPKSSRGGYRPGSGNKYKWKHGETKPVRIPIAIADEIVELAKAIDAGRLVPHDSVTQSSATRGEDELSKLQVEVESLRALNSKLSNQVGELETDLIKAHQQLGQTSKERDEYFDRISDIELELENLKDDRVTQSREDDSVTQSKLEGDNLEEPTVAEQKQQAFALDLLNHFLLETKDKKTGQPIMEALGKGSRDYKRLEQFKEWLEGRR